MNVEIVKGVIDNLSEYGVAYKKKHRCLKKTCVFVSCTPCILFSTFVRIIYCPFQCIFNKEVKYNPIISCLIDSKLSMASDNCIYMSIKGVDETMKLPIMPLLTNEQEIEVILYAADVIKKTKKIPNQYSISDFICILMFKHAAIDTAQCTPAAVLDAMIQIESKFNTQSLNCSY
jgi:hypothetical protein